MSLSSILTTVSPHQVEVSSTASPPPASPGGTALWELIVVAASPIALALCLCFCLVFLILKKRERVADVTPPARSPRRTPFANILRQLPPPPKYDIAVASSPPPPVYSNTEKAFDPLQSFSFPPVTASGNRNQSIQYLYPPGYDNSTSNTTRNAQNRSVSLPQPPPPQYGESEQIHQSINGSVPDYQSISATSSDQTTSSGSSRRNPVLQLCARALISPV